MINLCSSLGKASKFQNKNTKNGENILQKEEIRSGNASGSEGQQGKAEKKK